MQSSAAGQKKQPQPTKEAVFEAEQRLSDLGYWTGPVDGTLDSASQHAVIAFQKVERRERTGRLTNDELIALRAAERPGPREGAFAHVEIDLERQVLFYVDETGQVTKILPVSTGHGRPYNDNGQKGVARTPSGSFRVYKKINGWRRSTLGLLYYPSYFFKGYAIHGSPSVPAFPASHGCIRIPMFAAAEFSKLATMEMVVIVYDKTQVSLNQE
jgi:N-acetylmuramoyl-L-alanine amidase